MTILLGAGLQGSWTNLNPADDAQASGNAGMLDAIFGTLFGQLRNGKIVPQLATSWSFSNGARTFTIHLRQGVTFTDGTPFNAAAVLFNFQSDFNPKTNCTCLADFPIASMSTPNNYTVVMNLTRPDGAIVDAFPGDQPNWIVSPTHFKSLSASQLTTDLFPVGAGPFKVVSDTPNVSLTLVKNPSYWDKPYPYLNKLIFKPIANDSSALAAVQTGEAQVYGGYGEYRNVASITRSVDVYGGGLGTVADDISFNTLKAPFNNLKAREAIAYATNPAPINKALFANTGTYTQSPTGPGGLFYEPKVPGYLGYNPKKAKALVKQLGGHLSVQLLSMSGLQSQEIDEALQSEWATVGISTTISAKDIGSMVQQHINNNWELQLSNPGSYDPSSGFNDLSFNFGSSGILTGTKDPTLDAMVAQAAEPVSLSARAADFKKIFKYMSDKEYAVYLFVPQLFMLTSKNVTFSTKYLGLMAPPLQSFYETLAFTK